MLIFLKQPERYLGRLEKLWMFYKISGTFSKISTSCNQFYVAVIKKNISVKTEHFQYLKNNPITKPLDTLTSNWLASDNNFFGKNVLCYLNAGLVYRSLSSILNFSCLRPDFTVTTCHFQLANLELILKR